MNQPLVSFIIPYYNAGTTIQETIDSIYEQSYTNYDIWLINDGSTDSFSIEKLKDFEGNEKIHILHQQNAGPSVARNSAIKLSDAEFIIPLDADDKILKNTIFNSLKIFEKNKKIGIVYGNFEFFGEVSVIKNQPLFCMDKQLMFNQVAVSCLIRKKVFDEIGLYDENLSVLGLEDWEFWINLSKKGGEAVLLEKSVLYYRIKTLSRSTEINSNLKKNDQMINYIFQKHIELYGYKSVFKLYDEKLKLEKKLKNLQLHFTYSQIIILFAKKIKLSFKKMKVFLKIKSK